MIATTAATSSCLESCGWHQFIQRIRVFHGSNLLEDIDNYGQLAKILYDYQAPEDTVKGRFSITTGTNEEFSAVGVAVYTVLEDGLHRCGIGGIFWPRSHML